MYARSMRTSCLVSATDDCNDISDKLGFLHLVMSLSDQHVAGRGNSRLRDSSRGRMNRPFLMKRTKSRSPGRFQSDDETSRNDGQSVAKRKRHPILSSVAGSSISCVVPVDDVPVDRSQKMQSKHKLTRPMPDFGLASMQPARPLQRSKKEKSKETHRHSARSANIVSEDEDEHDAESTSHPNYTGPLAAAEYHRLKKEVENLRKQAATNAKATEKQSKVLAELKRELSIMAKANKEQSFQIEQYKSKSKQSEELLSSIEGNLQCQICIDILSKPYALSPCGHVLCQGCLQEWFRSAPANNDGMDTDDVSVIFRKKTCPCCRATVVSRPLPLFLIKSMVSSINRTKEPASAHQPSPPPDVDDPWVGLFPPPRDEDSEDSNLEYEYESDEEEEFSDDYEGLDVDEYDEYADTSDDEYVGPYIRPSWEPPHHEDDVVVDEDFEDIEIFRILRRGVTLDMIDYFNMEYLHDKGLVALSGGLTIHLGWNIDLNDDDVTGEKFMDWLMEDMDGRPDRWEIHDRIAIRLVRRDRIVDYETSDSDAAFGDDED
ncbi:hypothetical protein EW146_g7699 [Bondarzewia mesenterica]|uniref:RING-type domain-containing protein n=1 Tax=Bondarzewia mesenterica TaxID=1095465 RepID=A0A4S4LK21_9AGAM|nr:hypothetical protein EW146_g7699 [Bondarzewia mesenterica]